MNGQVCGAHVCTCTGGTAAIATDDSCEVDGAEDCTACETGYTAKGGACQKDLSAASAEEKEAEAKRLEDVAAAEREIAFKAQEAATKKMEDAEAAKAVADAQQAAAEAEKLRVDAAAADPKPSVSVAATVPGLTKDDHSVAMAAAVGAAFAESVDGAVAENIIVTLAAVEGQRRRLSADLSYNVLIAATDTAAATTLAAATNGVAVGALKTALETEMAKDPVLAAKKDMIGEMLAPQAAAKTADEAGVLLSAAVAAVAEDVSKAARSRGCRHAACRC